MKTNKKCVFLIPYFGKFNNYFQLFLDSCEKNIEYDWIIFTDNNEKYRYPQNVKKINISFEEIKEKIQKTLGFDICLKTPYKLCDYKPAYGNIFKEYIKNYNYWGHCDCDLIFGNLEKLLTPLLLKGYDKIFAAGHLTIYKNSIDNNSVFKLPYKSRKIYKEAFTTDNIFALDEDYFEENVHSIFLENSKKVFSDDLSMNCAVNIGKFVKDMYNPSTRKFEKEKYIPARYYWIDGDLFRLKYSKNTISRENFIYMHLQSRKMRMKKNFESCRGIQILPDRFVSLKKIPQNKKEMRLSTIQLSYMYWIDCYLKKITNKIDRILKVKKDI